MYMQTFTVLEYAASDGSRSANRPYTHINQIRTPTLSCSTAQMPRGCLKPGVIVRP